MEPKFRDKYPYERHPEENIDPEEDNAKMETETGMVLLQVKECQTSPEVERGKEHILP